MALSAMFPGRDLAAGQRQLASFADGFGVTLRFSSHVPNTRRALAMAEYARDQGKLDAFRTATMDAHWELGRDIENTEVLAELASGAGMDATLALAAAASAPMLARVDALGEEAQRWGVSGIPTYFILPAGWSPGDPAPGNGARPVRIVGCQPWESVVAGCARAQVAHR
jgi:predicted DsbA family dithiol-disulfide isomerase